MRLPLDLDGPAPTWPQPVDTVLEWWAGLPPRGRTLLRAALLVLALMAATGGLVDGRWGPPATVLVTVRDLPAGLPVAADDVVVARWPRDLVPPGALVDPAALATDAVADGRLAAGTPVTSHNVRVGGPGTWATAGTAVLPVPGDVLPVVPVGTRLDLAVAGLDGRADVVARSATVVADDGTWRWVRVRRDEVGGVAGGVGSGSLIAAVVRADP
jgi:hypothetical protein